MKNKLKKDNEEDIRYMKKLLEEKPTDIELRLKLGLRLISSDVQRLSNMAEAEEHLRVVVALLPNNASAFHLALAIQTQGKRGAEKYYEKAIKLNPEYVDAHYLVSKAYFDKNELSKVENHLEKALNLAPKNKVYQQEYKDLLEILQKQEKSKKSISRIDGR